MPPAPANAVEIEKLGFTYAPGRDGIDGSDCEAGSDLRVGSLTVGAGEQLLLVGTSGSGKSTLLHLLAGLMEPGTGTVRIGGTDIHALHGARRDLFRGRHVGLVFQSFHLLHGFSAIENVMAALMFSSRVRREHHAHAAELLSELGIERYDAPVGNLSVGQQQRVAVARALACEPTVVLADEPTASLDPENAEIAVRLLQRVCAHHGAALLCVSHDPAMVARFERVERLEDLASGDSALTGSAEPDSAASGGAR
ncbi:MAG: ABC-type lipoprotein export system ATPase subunit [Phycisphaerales bacterium]|jgi:ABC-type lipoprotein export system ATPase subunit